MEHCTIGQRIAAKRKELGLSQIALGDHMGVSRQSISKWESDAAIPEIDKLIALSKLFGVSVGWLLGVEEDPAPAQEPETSFTDREWEIIDQLTQSRPELPKWLVPLAAAAAAVALLAVVLSGAAFSAARSHREELAAVSQAIAGLTTGFDNYVPGGLVLDSHQFTARPSADLSKCTFDFFGYPAVYEEDHKAELLVLLGGQEVAREQCEWNGACYTASFTLPAANGYEAWFYLTDPNGVVRSASLPDPLLTYLQSSMAFGTVSVDFAQWDYDGRLLTLEGLQFVIDSPDVFRDTTGLWSRCDLVVMAEGRELGRIDILNRSEHSREINFGENDVDFFSNSQSIEIGDIAPYSRIELMLDCGFGTGLDLNHTIKIWTVYDGTI